MATIPNGLFGVIVRKNAGGGSFDTDLWQTFDFSGTVDATNLAANDNTAAGTWAVTDTASDYSTSVSSQQSRTSSFTGSSSDTYGLAIDHDGMTNAVEIRYTFDSAPDNLSVGFHFKTTSPANWSGGPQLIGFYNNSQGILELFTERRNPGTNARQLTAVYNGGAAITPVDDTWYWMTLQFNRNATSYMEAYKMDGTLLGSQEWTPANYPCSYVKISSGLHSQTGGVSRIDNLVMDWTDATYPLGP